MEMEAASSDRLFHSPPPIPPGDASTAPPQDSSQIKPSEETSSASQGCSALSNHSDSSFESSGKNLDSPEIQQQQPLLLPELPPSSGDIAVPEDSIAHLFSVYTFLRSFSVHLFLSPFTLADFVGSLNCTVKNYLADAVHLSLMKALRRHLESLVSNGSHFASKCLRYQDWSLLDTLTWPVFLLEFLYLRGLIRELGGRGFGLSLSSGEYYTLPVSVKLKILQVLCDEVMCSAEVKSELEKREEYSEDIEYDTDIGVDNNNNATVTVPAARRGRSSSRVLRTTNTSKESQEDLSSTEREASGSLDVGQDGNSDDCRICGMDGMLICCDGCPWAYHSRCIGLTKASLPQGQWFCHECNVNKLGHASARIERGARGACFFGIDAGGRQFVGTCDYLIVTRSLPDAEPYNRYYNRSDVAKVFYVLSATDEIAAHYSDISRGISVYWDGVLSGNNINVTSVVSRNVDAKCNGATTPVNNLHVHNNLSKLAACTIPYATPTNLKTLNSSRPAFKPYLYLNQYMHGDIAATAAATFAILSSEESNSKASDASNPRKAVHQKMLIQMRAFSQATTTSQFVWPSADRRLMEVPRDRCGWCMSCKGSGVNKKGCLLNWAASNAVKGSARSLSGLRPIYRTEESNVPSVATYIASMEESLQGLIDGALLDARYRDWWRSKIKEANDCNVLKFLLLELEKCIRGVALSSGWFRLLDEWFLELSFTGGAAAPRVTSNQRRSGGASGAGRRGKKRSGASDAASGGSDDSWKEVHWRRGGKLSDAVFQRCLLPKKSAKRAARQGGVKKIPGISYYESSEYPRRSRQFAWRMSVQTSKSTAQLALQVRYLNSHIKWRDLLPPDQISTEGKAAESDAAAVFRNAVICDKKMHENKILYALKFTNQKHLPVRVTKNVVEMEESDDGLSGKLWFYENHIPLYLIKGYEEKAKMKPLIGTNTNTAGFNGVPVKQRKRFQAYYKDIFCYLSERGNKDMKPPCASCKQQVLLRDVVRCIRCQGDCHADCMVSSSSSVIICKSCHAKHISSSHPIIPRKLMHIKRPPIMPLPIQEIKKVKEPVTKVVQAVVTNNNNNTAAVESESLKSGQKRKKPSPPTGESVCYGLRWRREGKSDTGTEFRRENLVLKKCKQQGLDILLRHHPICSLCSKPYDPDHMYIRCEKCLTWFHAVSVELQESQVDELIGFKCGKCRRKVQPKCPFVEQSSKKAKGNNKAHAIRPPVSSNTHKNNNPTEQIIPVHPLHSSDDDLMLFHDPLLSSYGKVEPVEQTQNQTSDASAQQSNQKLSVRRAQAIKNESDIIIPTNNETTTQATDSEDLNDVSVSSELLSLSLSPALEWDYSQGDGGSFGNNNAVLADDDNSNFAWADDPNHENLDKGDEDDFEPQTYFSFTELLAPEDNSLLEENHQIGVTFDELLANSAEEEEEDMVACDKCKGYDPAPDMTCEICNLRIHSYCSPWMESEESFQTNWKCGNCREWQ